MNPIAVVHLVVAALVVVSAIPLAGGRVKMNCWYGVRIPEAFVSEKRWFEINRHGGLLFLAWGSVLGATAVLGAFVPRKYWEAYNWGSLFVIVGGLAAVVVAIIQHARKAWDTNRLHDSMSASAARPAGRGSRRQ